MQLNPPERQIKEATIYRDVYETFRIKRFVDVVQSLVLVDQPLGSDQRSRDSRRNRLDFVEIKWSDFLTKDFAMALNETRNYVLQIFMPK